MKSAWLFLVFLIVGSVVFAENITIRIVDQDSGEAVAFARITIEYGDRITKESVDGNGEFSFIPKSFPIIVSADDVDFEENKVTIPEMPDSLVTIPLMPKAIGLNGVTVIGRLTTQTDNGISYNMAANERAQSENTMQALSYVPLVDVEPDGGISIQGSSSIAIYLNGRPYDMAQTSPKAFLESLPASSIAKVEVITHPDNKFGVNSDKFILNIVLKSPRLDGYVVNLSGMGCTQPTANGSVMGMIKKNKVEAAISYDYNLSGQRHQPSDITYTKKNDEGKTTHIWKNEGKGNGYWHTHIARAMFKWSIDSVNTIYADMHGKIGQTNITSENLQYDLFPTQNNEEIHLSNITKYTSGAVEANLIYRNYFRDDTQTERFTVGYHYTYNPDRRHMNQIRKRGTIIYPEYTQRTDGGLNAHNGLASYLLRLSSDHTLRFTASDIFRQGDTRSYYSMADEYEETGSSMRYTNNIAGLNITYSGRLGRFYCRASVKGNYDHLSMKLPQSPTLDFKRDRFYFLPSTSIYWRPDYNNALYLDYYTGISRPTIDMLNPYESKDDDHSISRGNPNLKAQYNHTLELTWYFTAIKNLTFVSTLEYTRSKDIILPTYYAEDSYMVDSYSNYGKSDMIEFVWNTSYNPINWMTISMNGSLGKRWLHSEAPHLVQNDMIFGITPKMDFYLPRHFRIGVKYGHYQNFSDPYSKRSSLNFYSLYVGKSFFSGKLNVTLTANSPFSKYQICRTVWTLPTMMTEQNNYMVARSFSIGVSYSFGGGKQIDLERDRILNSTDQTTGVD